MAEVAWISRRKIRQKLYWLISRDEGDRVETLTTRLPEDEEAVLVFSFREEAEMFLCLRALGDGWRIREAGTGELLSMLRDTLRDIPFVALDPIPETPGLGMFRLLSLDRETFMDGLADGVTSAASDPSDPCVGF